MKTQTTVPVRSFASVDQQLPSRRELLRRAAVVALGIASGSALPTSLEEVAAKGKRRRHGQSHEQESRKHRRSDRTSKKSLRESAPDAAPAAEPEPGEGDSSHQAPDHKASPESTVTGRASMPCTIAGPNGTFRPTLVINKVGTQGFISIRAEARLSARAAQEIRDDAADYYFQYNLWERDAFSDDYVRRIDDYIGTAELVQRSGVTYATGKADLQLPWSTLRSYGDEYYVGVHLWRVDGSNKRVAVATPIESNDDYI
jgi:hypothetical protein